MSTYLLEKSEVPRLWALRNSWCHVSCSCCVLCVVLCFLHFTAWFANCVDRHSDPDEVGAGPDHFRHPDRKGQKEREEGEHADNSLLALQRDNENLIHSFSHSTAVCCTECWLVHKIQLLERALLSVPGQAGQSPPQGLRKEAPPTLQFASL